MTFVDTLTFVIGLLQLLFFQNFKIPIHSSGKSISISPNAPIVMYSSSFSVEKTARKKAPETMEFIENSINPRLLKPFIVSN